MYHLTISFRGEAENGVRHFCGAAEDPPMTARLTRKAPAAEEQVPPRRPWDTCSSQIRVPFWYL